MGLRGKEEMLTFGQWKGRRYHETRDKSRRSQEAEACDQKQLRQSTDHAWRCEGNMLIVVETECSNDRRHREAPRAESRASRASGGWKEGQEEGPRRRGEEVKRRYDLLLGLGVQVFCFYIWR